MDSYSTHFFKRRNGELFKIELVIDQEKLAANLAERLCLKGNDTIKIAGGAVIARIME